MTSQPWGTRMTNQHSDMRRDALLYRALVPKGHRPTTLEDIDRMLDAIGDEPISQEKKDRMLRKINGSEPLFHNRSLSSPIATTELTEQELELVALHRSQKRPLPADLAEKLKAMEERASRNPEVEEGSDDG